tara:strand:- start:396 stop:1130 length:735 start_codon:yes stop_codon:yes gene_type:complete
MNNNQLHFLLVHGAWHGSWVWKEVAGSLLERGFKVSCPTLTGLGERKHLMSKNITIDTFITDVENHILYNDIKNIILVGHSFSGNVISGLAEKYKDRIKQLIYFDSMVVKGGQTPFDITNSEITKERIKLAEEFDNGVSIPPPSPEKFGIKDFKLTKLLEEKLTPTPLSAFQSKLIIKNEIGNGIPLCYVKCIKPLYEALHSSREKAKELRWPTYDLQSGHDAMLSHPHETINLFFKILSDNNN